MKDDTAHNENFVFSGFEQPESNFFRMPNTWTNVTARIDNIAELKVVEYTLRHTWGFGEYVSKKHITVDEYMHGRKRKDGSRMDAGTRLSESSVKRGLARAIAHGFLEEEIDASDRARIRKSYGLHMRTPESDNDAADEATLLALASLRIQLHTLLTHLLTIAVEQILPSTATTRTRTENRDQATYPPAPPQDIGGVRLNPQDVGGSERTLDEVNLIPRSEKDTPERHLFPDSPDRDQLGSEGENEAQSESPTSLQPLPQSSQVETAPERGGGFTRVALTINPKVRELVEEGLLMPANEAPPPHPRKGRKRAARGIGATKRGRVDSATTRPPARPLVASRRATGARDHNDQTRTPRASARVVETVTRFAREFGDPKINACISQANRIQTQSGLSEQAFLDWLYTAASEVHERQRDRTQDPLRKPMAYFFQVLKNHLGLLPERHPRRSSPY